MQIENDTQKRQRGKEKYRKEKGMQRKKERPGERLNERRDEREAERDRERERMGERAREGVKVISLSSSSPFLNFLLPLCLSHCHNLTRDHALRLGWVNDSAFPREVTLAT